MKALTGMSFKTYKWVDIGILSVIAVVFEFLNFFASTSFESFKLIFLSYSIVICLIACYRWGLEGIVVGILGSLAACVAAKSNDPISYFAYITGALAQLIPILIFQYLIGRERIIKKYILIPYLVISFVTVVITRCFVGSLFADNFLNDFIANLQYEVILESMSLVISIIILLIASRKKGNLLVDMYSYIKDLKDHMILGGLKEYHEMPNFNFDKPFTEEDQMDDGNILDGGTLSYKELKELDEMYQKSQKNKN